MLEELGGSHDWFFTQRFFREIFYFFNYSFWLVLLPVGEILICFSASNRVVVSFEFVIVIAGRQAFARMTKILRCRRLFLVYTIYYVSLPDQRRHSSMSPYSHYLIGNFALEKFAHIWVFICDIYARLFLRQHGVDPFSCQIQH